MRIEFCDDILICLVLPESQRSTLISDPDRMRAADLRARFPYIVRVGGLDEARYGEISRWVEEHCRGAVITNYRAKRYLDVWESAFGLADEADAVLFKLRWNRAFPTSDDVLEWA